MTERPGRKSAAYDNLPRPVVAMENAWPAGASTGWHAHPRGQLLFATEGVMLVDTEAGAWVVPPNRALWMVAALRHNVVMSGDVLIRTAYIDATRIPHLPDTSGVINVSPLLRELLGEAVRLDPNAELSPRDARLLALIVDELRASSAIPLHLPMPDDPRLRRICHALIAEPANGSGAADWAHAAGVAERTLHRLFAKQTGMSFAQWRGQARLLHAVKQLAAGGRVIDVALECGYASPSAFAAMFRRHFGGPPSMFYR